MIRVKLLHADAKVPTVTYAGSDLGFDLYSVEAVVLLPGVVTRVRTGIAVEGPVGTGFVLGDRSSMAARGVTYVGGRIDAGYRGEIIVCLVNVNQPRLSLALERDASGTVMDARLVQTDVSVSIAKGDKIVQMSPFRAQTELELVVVDDLTASDRAAKGFGSSGR